MRLGLFVSAAAIVLAAAAPALANDVRAGSHDSYIKVAADDRGYDTGRNNDGWRRDRDDNSGWNRGPRRDDDGRQRDDRPGNGGWMPLDRLSFEGSNDIENAFTGWRGRFIDRMALRSVNVTARCNRVIARYRDGDSVTLAKNRKLEQGETVILDLPGGRRPLDTIYLRCHAFGNGRALIEVLGQR